MKQVVISTRIPAELAEKIDETIAGRYVNAADFVRDIIRDEILRSETEKLKMEFAKDKDSVKLIREFRKVRSQLFTGKDYDTWVKRQTTDMP